MFSWDAVDRDKLYLVEGDWLLAVRRVAKKLYLEKRMTGDDMRDAAQLLCEFGCMRIVEYEEEKHA